MKVVQQLKIFEFYPSKYSSDNCKLSDVNKFLKEIGEDDIIDINIINSTRNYECRTRLTCAVTYRNMIYDTKEGTPEREDEVDRWLKEQRQKIADRMNNAADQALYSLGRCIAIAEGDAKPFE